MSRQNLGLQINVVYLLGQGQSFAQVAHNLMLDDQTVSPYWELFQEGGVEKLKETHYQGSQAHLDENQLAELKKHLQEKTYTGSQDICEYIQKSFNVSYTRAGVVPVLHRIGFSYKKPKVVPSKANPVIQEELIQKYGTLRAGLNAQEQLFFMDGAHPTHNAMPAYGWIEKGKTKELKTNSGRQRIKLNGLYSPLNQEIVFREDERINAESNIALFQKLEATYPEGVNGSSVKSVGKTAC